MLNLQVYEKGVVPYEPTWQEMRAFTAQRTPDTIDECWLLEHPPVFTQGQAGKPEHVLNPQNIPVVQTDRGGQVTYHGPGQLICYILWDLKRLKLSVRDLVHGLEESVIRVLHHYGVAAMRRDKAPGVYVHDAKVCSLGLRVRKGFTYHGIAFNINMDLTPFKAINPCGFQNLPLTQLANFCYPTELPVVGKELIEQFQIVFGYNHVTYFSS